ncbi:putative ribonuclease H-like domain-containing protein [Tanacetum coccineum]
MEFESTNSGTTAKLPILKLGEYEMWVIRIKQYFQIQDYALWEVIENGDLWNNVKARGLLLMKLPNEHQLTFSQHQYAKSMFVAIETRFRESLDSIFNRIQKIVSRLAILGVIIAQEDLNSKFLSSLPPEWNTHVVVWMNKPEVETMSIDDLYNNFKIVEQKVKKSVGASSGAQNLAFMTAPSTSSTNDANTASPQVSVASTNVNAASLQVCTASVSGNTVYDFMVENPNGSNFLHQDLDQIHKDDLEAMDLKWQLSLLSVRAKKYYQRTGKKIFINANDTAVYDKSKVECYNCHKLEHFAREYRAPRSKEGFDWSDMAEEQVQTNMALMAFSDLEVYTDKTCFKTCLKNYETLMKQCDDLIVKLNQTEFIIVNYKRGLATIEAQLITYRKNEVLFSKEDVVLKREVACKDYEINVLKSEFEKVKQEKDGIDFKIEKFDKASKDLDQLLGSQITDKSKKGLGYSAVPPPHHLIYNRPKKLDLSYSGLDEFKEPEFKGYGPENSKQESNVVCDKESDNSKEKSDESLVEEQVSQDKRSFVESSPNVDKETVFPVNKKIKFSKPKDHEKPVKKSVRYAEMYRSQSPKRNQRNWNGQNSNQLGKDFVMYNKACFICRSFNHLQINYDNHQRRGVVFRNNYNMVDAKTTHPSVLRNMSPKVVLLKTGLTPLNIVRPVNTAHPKTAVHSAKSKTRFSKQAQSTAKRPFYKQTTLTRRSGKPQHDDKGFVDSGCSRHITRNITYLSYFKEFDGGYVAFGGGAYGGRITGKGTLKTNSLDFEDVYFVNELKFNLFSVSQMCDKKNHVFFTDTECLVLSPNFKLSDENQILLKIPRKDNMYSFDMKNIVPKENFTCLVAKATLDESMLWHRRLCHINFKNINKLVQDNLVRGLPTKRFEKDQTCVACLKGKQHRASCKSKVLNPITKPLFMLHMDLFGPTFVSSLMHKKYCLVVTDDYSRFTWVFFLTAKDETNEILKNFIKEIENLVDKKVKIIRSDNGTEFKNKVLDDFCREKESKTSRHIKRGWDTKIPQSSGPPDKGSGPRCQDTILRDVNAQTRFEITSKQSNDPPFLRGYTLRSGENSMKLLELMELCTQLSYKNRKSVLTVNGVHQLQALVDKKRVIVTESSIWRDLYLDDAEGTDCLPTATIFEELTRMGAKSTAWNEFSSSMASLIICLATNQKFNLSKYIFDAMESKEKTVEGSEEKAKGSRKKILGRKRAGKEKQQESLKKQRIVEDKESDEVDEASKDDEGGHAGTLPVDKSKWKFQEDISSNDRMTLQGMTEKIRALWRIVKTKYSVKKALKMN